MGLRAGMHLAATTATAGSALWGAIASIASPGRTRRSTVTRASVSGGLRATTGGATLAVAWALLCVAACATTSTTPTGTCRWDASLELDTDEHFALTVDVVFGLGEDLDIDLVARDPQLLQRKTHGFIAGSGLNLNGA